MSDGFVDMIDQDMTALRKRAEDAERERDEAKAELQTALETIDSGIETIRLVAEQRDIIRRQLADALAHLALIKATSGSTRSRQWLEVWRQEDYDFLRRLAEAIDSASPSCARLLALARGAVAAEQAEQEYVRYSREPQMPESVVRRRALTWQSRVDAIAAAMADPICRSALLIEVSE